MAIIKIFGLILCLSLFTGCSLFSEYFADSACITVQAKNELNKNKRGKSSPVILRIFQLRDSAFFKTADFMDVYDGTNPKLKEHITLQQEYEIWPSSKMSFRLNLKTETKYIGMVAAYRNHSESRWKVLEKVNSQTSQTLKVILRQNELFLKEKD